MNRTTTILILLCLASAAFAVNNVAVLELVPNESVAEEISIEETKHLTDELRKQAVMTLPRSEYSVLTRDNILALIPPDEADTQCLAESCAVEIGRAIGAEYISQGTIGKFGKKLTISVELYETMSSKLLYSIVFESSDIDGLLGVIRKEAKPLFQSILIKGKKPSEAIKINAGESSTDGMTWNKWVGIGLAVAGIGVGIYGIMQESEYKDLNKKYLSADGDFDGKWKKAEDAKGRRNLGYVLGGVLLAGGITVFFVF